MHDIFKDALKPFLAPMSSTASALSDENLRLRDRIAELENTIWQRETRIAELEGIMKAFTNALRES